MLLWAGHLHVSLLMTRVRTFQLLVVASVLAYGLWMALPQIPRALSPEVQQMLSTSGYGGQAWVMDPRYYFSVALAKVLASVGLVLFLSWGRWLFLGVAAVAIASVPFSGVSVGAPMDNAVGYVATLLDGAILALAFSSPLSEAMRRDE